MEEQRNINKKKHFNKKVYKFDVMGRSRALYPREYLIVIKYNQFHKNLAYVHSAINLDIVLVSYAFEN